MDLNGRSKQCPRCRFMLSKTHSDKMICKRCGYTSNKLQIVAEQDQFNTNIRYNKRVSFKKQSQIDPTHQQNTHQICLKHFQHLLKYIGSNFIQHKITHSIKERQKANQTFKNLWFGYLQKMSREGNVISATFVNLAQRSVKKNQQQNNAQADKSEEQNSSDESQGEKQQKKQKEQANQEEKSVQEIKGKRGRKRKVTEDPVVGQQNLKKKAKPQQVKDQALREFKKIVNQTLKSFKAQKSRNSKAYNAIISKQFLTKILTLARSKAVQCSFSSLMYLAQKYSWILVVSQIYQSHNKHQLDNKLQNKYVSQQDLKEICRQRDLHYEKRRLYTQLTVLSHDLLEMWYKETFKSSVQFMGWQQPYPYAYLLETYRSEPNKPAMLQTIMRALENMSEQTVIKMEQRQKKVPELSLKFICALVYLTMLINQQTFTILQVINHVIQTLSEYVEENKTSELIERKEIMELMMKERNVKVKRIKKIAHQLFGYIEEFLGEQTLHTQKWCMKYSRIFGIPQKNSKELQLLTETLINGYIDQNQESLKVKILNGNYMVHNTSTQRYLFIQQPQIILSSLVIYLKLIFGLDRGQYPYLKSIGEITSFIQQKKQYLKDPQDILKIQYLLNLVSTQPKELNQNYEFSLMDLIRTVNKQFRPVFTQLQLKDISGKKLAQMTRKISQFREMMHKKQQQHKLSLMSNFSQFNMSSNELRAIEVTVVSEEQRQKEKIPELYRHMRNETTLKIKEQAAKALDYLFEKHKRHTDKSTKNKQQKEGNQQYKENQNNMNIEESEQLSQQKDFKVSQNIDKPQRHYQIVYHPTINTLSQLNYNQLLVIVESLSLLLNGQYSDCKDILQWMGLLQSVLKEFEA